MTTKANAADTIDEVLRALLGQPAVAAPARDVASWWASGPWSEASRAAYATHGTIDPAAAALRGGFAAAVPAFAFASGYEAALRRLVPALPDDGIAALCVTEGAGGRPSDMATTLERGRLVGTKTYVTLGLAARVLLVAARHGSDPNGRARIALVRVDLPRDGVSVSERAPLPFVPEIAHAVVALGSDVDDTMVLPGDGYADYVKPFRTIEDVHVHLALGAYLLRVARAARWPRTLVEDLVALLAAGAQLARADAKSPAVHLALAGHLRAFKAWLAQTEAAWAETDADERARWQRDRALLQIAAGVREQRTEAAWRALAEGVA